MDSVPAIVQVVSDTYIAYRYGCIPMFVVKAENELKALQLICTYAGFTTGDLEVEKIVMRKVEYGTVMGVHIGGPTAT